MWRRVVAGLSAFMLSPGVVVVVAAAYFATAAAANFPPFGPQHAVHSSNSLPQSTAISSHHSGSPTPSPSKCSTGTLTLVGSTAFAPIAQVVGDAYRDYCASAHIVVHVVVNAKDSAQGFTTLRQTEAQNPGNADLMIAMYDGTETSPAPFTAKPVGVLIYAIVANNTDIPESSISVGGLENIFVPPGKQGVVAVGRLAGSGSRKALLDGVFHLKDWGSVPVSDKSCPPPSGYTACTEDYTGQVLNSVSAVPDAIGYAGYTWFAENRTTYPNVHVVNIGDVAPGTQAVKDRSYNFWVVEHLYTTTQPAALTSDFLAFLSNYLASDLQDGFLACPAVPKSLGTDC